MTFPIDSLTFILFPLRFPCRFLSGLCGYHLPRLRRYSAVLKAHRARREVGEPRRVPRCRLPGEASDPGGRPPWLSGGFLL